ncbi:hypothetical protein [Bradyrhizobium sp. RDM4]|uniref:hypothetical protein n=1 Tax=Bradyrhizobium sp. RDM4 TaxID=3378765 RepID=UPI0038FC308D
MKLIDLDPRWLESNGRKVGIVFTSPTDPKWRQTCFFEPTPRMFACDACKGLNEWKCLHSQSGLVEAAGVDPEWFQGCKTGIAWRVHGPLDFAVLTITPSIDGSAGGLWHGFITKGEIR